MAVNFVFGYYMGAPPHPTIRNMFGHMPFNCVLRVLVSQAVLLQSRGQYSERSGCGMQVVYIAARDMNLVPEPVTFNSKKVDTAYSRI